MGIGTHMIESSREKLHGWVDADVSFYSNAPDNIVVVMDCGELQTIYGAASEESYKKLMDIMEGLGDPFEYLALYCWQDKTLAVLAEEDLYMPELYNTDIIGLYKDKIYYSTGIIETIRYKSTWTGETHIIEDKVVIGQKVVRMNVDGSELRKIGQVSNEFPWEEE